MLIIRAQCLAIASLLVAIKEIIGLLLRGPLAVQREEDEGRGKGSPDQTRIIDTKCTASSLSSHGCKRHGEGQNDGGKKLLELGQVHLHGLRTLWWKNQLSTRRKNAKICLTTYIYVWFAMATYNAIHFIWDMQWNMQKYMEKFLTMDLLVTLLRIARDGINAIDMAIIAINTIRTKRISD